MSPCPKGTISYRVKPGDTYHALARRFNTTVKAISSANPEVNPNNLRLGELICIPITRSIASCPPEHRYIVKAGDTYSKLAQKYGIPAVVIISLNPGADPTNLQVGQIICLPVRKRRRHK